MKATVKETKNLIEKINSERWIYEKYSLIGVGSGNYWLYQWDFAKNIGKWLAKWKIWHIFELLMKHEYDLTIPYQENDFKMVSRFIKTF